MAVEHSSSSLCVCVGSEEERGGCVTDRAAIDALARRGEVDGI